MNPRPGRVDCQERSAYGQDCSLAMEQFKTYCKKSYPDPDPNEVMAFGDWSFCRCQYDESLMPSPP